MPPLGVKRLKAMPEHDATQKHAIGKLLGCDATPDGTLVVIARVLARLRITTEVGMALRSKPVEGPAHVEFFLCLHVEKR